MSTQIDWNNLKWPKSPLEMKFIVEDPAEVKDWIWDCIMKEYRAQECNLSSLSIAELDNLPVYERYYLELRVEIEEPYTWIDYTSFRELCTTMKLKVHARKMIGQERERFVAVWPYRFKMDLEDDVYLMMHRIRDSIDREVISTVAKCIQVDKTPTMSAPLSKTLEQLILEQMQEKA